MEVLLRRSWFRITLVFIALLAVTAAYPHVDENRLRENVTDALRSTTLLFAVCTALSLSMLNNYIKGLKDSAISRISEIRKMLESYYDEFNESEDENLQEIVHEYILPLLYFSTSEWLAHDPIRPVLGRIVDPLTRLVQTDPEIAPRYFLRLEDEINELGINYVKRVISGLHAKTIVGSFVLISVGIVSILLVALMPPSFTFNFVAVLAATAVMMFAVLELLLLVSYLRQEAREELPEEGADEMEDEEAAVNET